MTKEEIENRILVCEIKENEYLEVGNTKTANRYRNEKYKWEKLLEQLDIKMYEELKDYKKGYFNLQQENKELKILIECLKMGVTLNEKQEELLDNILFGNRGKK